MPLGCSCWQHAAEYTAVQSMLEPMHAAVGKPNGGAPSRVLVGRIHVVCHAQTQKPFARHCVATGEGHAQRDNLPPSYSSCTAKESFWHVTLKECLALTQTEVQSMLELFVFWLSRARGANPRHQLSCTRWEVSSTHTEVSFLRTSRCEAAA